MKKKPIFIALLSSLAVLFSGQLIADEYLSADQIKALITGKTIQAEHLKKDFKFSVYFDADGKTAHRNQNDATTKTTYKFEGNKHCIHWDGKDRCANVKDNGDGTYSRINPKGKAIVKWTKIEDGNKT